MKPDPGPDAKTRLYGIFGDPVRHSLSPVLHNALFKKRGLNAVYLAFRVEKDRLGLAFEAVRSLDMGGVNLTIPLKEEALAHLDEIPEDLDRATGAVNTVVNRDGRLFGYNTDGPGFIQAVAEELELNPSGKRVLILGAGGAARGAAFALAGANVGKLYIANRSHHRAHGLAEYLEGHFPDLEVEASAPGEAELKDVALVVNATSLGLHEHDASPWDFKGAGPKTAAYDMVYGSHETAFLKAARAKGLRAVGGLGMLVNQAALSFQLWTGEKDGVREGMREALSQWRS